MAAITVPDWVNVTLLPEGMYAEFEAAEPIRIGDYCRIQPDGRMAKANGGDWYTDRDMQPGERRTFVKVVR
jgi:hypothetical protein